MHPEKIKAELRIAGWTQAALADALEVAGSSVAQTISGRIRSPLIQGRIATIIGQPIDKIWPNQVRLRRSSSEVAAQRRSAA